MVMVPRKPMHGTAKAAGCSHARLGNFCKLLGPDVPSWSDDCGVAEQCVAEAVAAAVGGVGGLMHDVRNESGNSALPSGYTFFAQFVDHDVTFDTTSPLHGGPLSPAEVSKLANLRSASLDLDCVYGLGPEAMPFMFDGTQPGRLLVGSEVDGVLNPRDVPRNRDGSALIGDPRNDENLFISQLQTVFLEFHNRMLVGRDFEGAQEETRFHYQYVVLHDFLSRVCHPDVYAFALPLIEANARGTAEKKYPFCDLRDSCHRLCMPIEFSVAAFRFGHTLVRSTYPANRDYPRIELFDERFGTLGFGPVPPELTVDWRFLLDLDPCHPWAPSKAFDHLLADELIRLPDPVVGRNAAVNDRALAFRNILRGHALGLPSGQRVAAELEKKGYSQIDPKQDLRFGDLENWSCLTKGLACDLADHTPLFLYLMREAGVVGGGESLGPVGSAILLETFGNMFVHCDTFLKHDWAPDPCIAGADGLTLADLVRWAQG